MLEAVGRPRFDALVKSHESDKYCNGNASWMQFGAMLYARITDANGLRSIEEAFRRNRGITYHLGLDREIKRSSISYANNTRDCLIFYDLFTQLASGLSSGGRRKMRKALFAVDATTISLNKKDYSWAAFRETKAGIKVHVQYKVDDESSRCHSESLESLFSLDSFSLRLVSSLRIALMTDFAPSERATASILPFHAFNSSFVIWRFFTSSERSKSELEEPSIMSKKLSSFLM